MKIQKLLITGLITLSLIGCGALTKGTVTTTNSTSYQKTNPDDVTIYISQKPEQQFTEIGTVSAASYKFTLIFPKTRRTEDVKKEIKEKAASIGGNAIIDYHKNQDGFMVGTVVRFK